MQSSCVSVIRPVVRSLALFLLAATVAFSMACGHSSSTTVTTAGPAPTFTSKWPTVVQEGVQYTYDLTTTTTDNSKVTYKLSTGPSGATISGNTLTWTPTHAEARISNSFGITATTGNNGTATQTFTLTPTGSIDGTVIDHAVTGNGIQDYPEDLSGLTIEALIPNGSGGYNVMKGSGDSSGNFTIPNIPAGPFFLHLPQNLHGTITNQYIWSTASDIDAGSLVNGRPDAAPASGVTVSTNVTLSVAPNGSDAAYWSSPDVYAVGHPSNASVTQPFITSFPQTGYLLDSAKGDRAFLTHYKITQPTASSTAQHIVEDKEYDSITESDNSTVSLTGAMSSVGGSTIDPVIKVTQFDALFSGLTNTGTITRQFSLVDPGYDAAEGYAGGVPLITASITSNTDTDLGSLAYGLVTKTGVPFYSYTDTGYRTFSTGSGSLTLQVGSMVASNVLPTSSSSIVPVVGLVQAPLVNGVDFYGGTTTTTLQPTIAWGLPSTGTGTYYIVNLYDISNLSPSNMWTFYTNTKSVLVPSGILQNGHLYVVQITAADDSADTFATAPFRTGTSPAYSYAVSGVIVAGSGSSTKRVQSSDVNLLVTHDATGRIQVQNNH